MLMERKEEGDRQERKANIFAARTPAKTSRASTNAHTGSPAPSYLIRA